jgi:hypothetical protein
MGLPHRKLSLAKFPAWRNAGPERDGLRSSAAFATI